MDDIDTAKWRARAEEAARDGVTDEDKWCAEAKLILLDEIVTLRAALTAATEVLRWADERLRHLEGTAP